MKTSQVLMRAAKLIEQRGWTQGTDGWDGSSGFCVEGAIAAAAGVIGYTDIVTGLEPCPAYAAVVDFLGGREAIMAQELFRPSGRLYAWNDSRHRTAQEVIDTLKAAAIAELIREKHAEYDLRDAVNEAMSNVELVTA